MSRNTKITKERVRDFSLCVHSLWFSMLILAHKFSRVSVFTVEFTAV